MSSCAFGGCQLSADTLKSLGFRGPGADRLLNHKQAGRGPQHWMTSRDCRGQSGAGGFAQSQNTLDHLFVKLLPFTSCTDRVAGLERQVQSQCPCASPKPTCSDTATTLAPCALGRQLSASQSHCWLTAGRRQPLPSPSPLQQRESSAMDVAKMVLFCKDGVSGSKEFQTAAMHCSVYLTCICRRNVH